MERGRPDSDDSSGVHPQAQIGHVHLKVADLDRAIDFYRGVLGFELTQWYDEQAAFLSAGGYHHIGLNNWECLGGPPPPAGTTGLYHLAILYPTRAALADALRRVLEAGVPLDGASDHGVSEALYLHDPDVTAWNSTGTTRPRRGREHQMAGWPCSHGGQGMIWSRAHPRISETER